MTKQKKSSKMNSNKTISVNSNGIIISYTDSNKHQFISYENKDFPKNSFNAAKYQEIEKPVFNDRQHKMYLEAMYGLNNYSEEMINKMPRKVVFKIATRCVIVQREINKWKQEIVNERIDKLLLSLFPNSPTVKKMVNLGVDDTVKSVIPFKDLGINHRKIADKLISLNLLPKNFFEIA